MVNADLANNLGNLLNRSLNLLRKNCDSTPELDSSSIHHPLRAYTEEKIPNVMKKMQAMEFSDACAILMEILHEANLYIATEEPWVIFKRWVKFKRREKEEAVNCLCTCLECAWITAVALKPITPALSDRIYNALGFPSEERTGKHHHRGKPSPSIFPRKKGKRTTPPRPFSTHEIHSRLWFSSLPASFLLLKV